MAYPFLVVESVTVAGGATGTLSYSVPRGESFEFEEIYFQSTGAFSITDIRNSRSNSFTNALGSNTIPSVFLQNIANENNTIKKLRMPLMIEGNDTIYIDVVDTSASGNTIQVVLNGTKTRTAN